MSENRDNIFERVVLLEGIDLRELSGVNNENISYLSEKFPKLKITFRGEKMRIGGNQDEISHFCERFEQLIAYYNRYNHLSPTVIDQVFSDKVIGKKGNNAEKEAIDDDVILFGNNGNVIKARTPNQQIMVDLYNKCDLMFAMGPAGSGKTYTAIALAVRALKNKQVKRIILTRPAVEAGEKLGFLPGDMKDKLDPYLQPLYDALFDMMPQKKLTQFIEEGIIQIAPLAFMRGRTLDNAVVILDEAQNCTTSQLKMFLTRMGRNSKFMVTGDATQIDLEKRSESGLLKTVSLLRKIDNVAVIEMKSEDIVRHQLVKDIVAAFAKI